MRGELIQVQCAAARLPEDDPGRRALADRAEELLARHEPAFVDTIEVAGARAIERLEAARRTAPIRDVTLILGEGGGDALDALGRTAPVERLRLRVRSTVTLPDDAIESFVRGPHAASLVAVALELGPPDRRHLLVVPGVEDLELHQARAEVLPTPLLEALAALSGPSRVHLRGVHSTVELWRALEGRPITHLTLTYGRRLDAAAALRLPRLTHLDVRGRGLRDGDLAELAGAGSETLVGLGLALDAIGDKGLAALASAPRLPRLTELDLFDTNVGPAGLRALAGTPLGERLRALSLGGSAMTLGYDTTFGEGRFAALERLSTPMVTRRLPPGGMPALRDLTVGSLDDAAARELAGSAGLPSLRRLTCWTARRLSDDGARALAASPHLGRLVRLALGTRSGHRIGRAGLAALRERFGPGALA